MASPSLPCMIFKAALVSLLAASSVPQECNVRPKERPPGAALGTGLLQTKPAARALEKTGFEESMLKAMGKLEEELKDLKTKAELKNEDAGLKEELAELKKQDAGLKEELAELKNEDAGLKEELGRLQRSQSPGDAFLEKVPPMPRGRVDLPGIFAQHQNASERRSSCKKAAGLPLTSLVGGNSSDASKLKTKKVEVHRSNAGCPSGEVKLFDFQPTGATQSCCKEEACAGCAFFSGSSCQRCAGGFIEREGQCTACTSSGGWLSVDGKSCMQLAASDCSDEEVRGQSSNEACCQCGGGVVTPTPFSYPNSRWSLDSNIVMKPEPRTARRYTVDSKCELAAHNLTIDSSTGEISYMSGRTKPVEAFSFECEVTAHQATGVSLASVVTVAADVLSYSSATLLFHGDSEEELPLTTGSGWSKFELGCAPEVSWLSIVASTGKLRYTAPSGANGGVSVADDKFFGQDGAVCIVTAWQTHKKHQTTFVAIRPRPWPKLEYDLDAVAVSVGEDLHPLIPKPHKEQGLMKPWTFSMACDVSGAASSTKFTYDRILNMGLLDGHPILDISPDGAITVAPASTLSELFDALSVSGSQRKAFTLGCRVFGLFPDPELPAVETTLSIVVQDTVCWVPQNIKGTGLPDPSASTEAKCRSQCRADETCANYQFDSQCKRYDVRSDGNPVTVIAKVTNCTNEGTCMKVTHSEWYLAGTYCPLGRDAVLGGIVYLREHVTQQDMVYLREGSSGGCGANEWALMAPSSADFIDKALGLFELRGTRHACISSSTVEHALLWCPTKALAWIEEQEEDEEGQPALVLDDPGTAQPADFWLHPCDCAPDAWGPDLPVDPQMYEHLPANSSNQFIPTPYVIVKGQLVCPSRQLLGGSMGVHFQSEEEVLEPADCEARCREQSTCLFFWHGSQHGASTCRLFSGCDNLVREFSLEGDLKAMPRSPSCTVADAVKCWATSLRRSFLSMAFSPSGGPSGNSASAGVDVALNLPPKPAAPPADGMVAWFESENAGNVWRSSVGDFEGHCNLNTVYRQVEAGNGADRPVTFIEGYTWSGYDFGNVLPPTHTVCSITRYGRARDGSFKRGRILQSRPGNNWLHGHWSNRAGVAYYNGWLTSHERNIDVTDWVVLCGTNGAQRAFDGLSSGTPANIASQSTTPVKFTETIPLYINHGGVDEKSEFQVMEVITWDRVLSEGEMVATVDYLKWKLRAGAVLETSEHVAQETEKNFDFWANQALDHVEAQTFEVDLANGYKADLTGWPHTRDYARGFLTNKDGVSTAVVKGLTPAAQYLYQIYMVHERVDWAGQAKVSVNHGVQGRCNPHHDNEAAFSGVAVASPRGEINFEFERISWHVHLSGIAIAKVGQPPDAAKPADPPSQGMYAWFKSENAGSVWRSSVGDFEGHCNMGSVFRRVAAGNGADRPVTFIEGYTWSGYDFGNVIPPTHTVCSITRYNGPHKRRILQSRLQSNWLHGHWSRQAGVAYYNGWLTSYSRTVDVMDWVVLCGTNGAQRAFDGFSSGTPANIASQSTTPVKFTETIPLYINHGGVDEKSEFQVMEVITWDRVLSEEEMVATVDYLKWKLRAGAVLEASEHLAQETEKNFDFWANQALDHVEAQTFEVNLANGYQADLTGWPHTRNYARGFLTNKDGVSTAVVKGLTPAAQYLYQIYMVHERPDWQGEAKVSVNHGVQGTCHANGNNEARFSGVAVASPRGEINFEFERVSWHLHLSGIAIAKVSSPASLLQKASIATGRTEGAVEQGFIDLHLYQQCDSILLLGGMGVEQCGRPSHREIASHDWQHKRPLPPSFKHGTLLMASCWSERYRLLRENRVADTERLQCVNGDWYNSLGKPGLNGLVCEGCVQVGARGYAAYDERNEQELYFFNRMALSIYTELGMVKELDVEVKHKYCLQPSDDGNMTVQASSTCPAKLLSQVTGWAGPQARLFKLLPLGEGTFDTVTGKRCKGSPFTSDPDASCDGFKGLSVEQCQKKCADSEKAPNCPQKTCGGAVSFQSGWCHLYEECSESELDDNSAATAIIGKADQCLSTKGDSSGLVHVECNATNAAQHLEPAELPTDMWDLHIEADERTQDLHKPFSSYCGTSGALSSLDFGQLFAGDTGTSQTTCKFAPLIQFGAFVDTAIVRSKTTTNWPDWHHLLAENYVECASGEALTAFKLDAAKNIYKYECSKIGGLGSCFDYYSAQVEIPSFSQSIHHWAKPIRMMPVSCGQNAVLGSFHFEFSEGGKWGRVRYQCCKAGGAPVSFDPRGQLPELVGRYDGIYCPSGRDSHSGRVKFEGGSGLALSFKRSSGQWCLESECSETTDGASPLGMKGAAFDVVNVSDFDGEFLGQMPKEESKALSLEEALRMKPPRRPPMPKMPELEEFKAQQPKYAEECLNYENLWKDVTETYLDEEDEEVQTTSKLEADPATKEQALDSYHPCEVAKGAGGIFGQWGGGDGSTAPENMMYADWNDCMQGDIERDLASAKLDYHSALSEFVMDLVEETMGAVCGVIPDVMIAPFGAGVALNPGEICDGISELLGAVKNFAGPASGFHFARQGWSIEQEGYAACNPMQIGFARAFCDIHCVRDAVIRGDRSIIRNLEMATKKTNNNLKALVKWSVDASHTDIGWIGEKLDYMHIINTAYMQEIHDMVTKQSQAAEEELVQGTESATDALFSEMAGYAQAASFDELSKITAKGALEEFLESADLSPKANATAAASLLARLDALHQTLQRAGRGREKSEMLNRQVAQTVRHLQRQASFHLRTLGVYRQESNASSHAARGKGHKALARERHQVLMSLDHIWWQLRTKLDGYLDVAEDEVKAFQTSLAEMNSYLDCKKGFSDLAAGYAQSISALSRSHRQLRDTWRQGTNLLGELASVLADSEAFKGFVTEQGCTSELVKQTLQQLQSGIFGMAFLLHRFRAAKLPEPDTAALKQATKRIQEAYAAATAKCH